MDIKNAAPMVIDQGTKDLSMRTVGVSSLISPQHLPKFYIFAETGPVGGTYIDFSQDSLTNLYGDDTFNVEKKYYTHQTPFLQAAASAGNNCIVHRIVSANAADAANVALYLDVLPTQVPIYRKNTDGSVALDLDGNPIVMKDGSGDDITMAGFKVCWVTDFVTVPLGQYEPGTLLMRNGIQNEGAVQSMQYPIFEIAADHAGDFGKKLATRFYAALQTDQYPFPSNFLNDTKVYPYYFQMLKANDNVTGKTVPMLNGYGSQFSRFASKKGAIDPTSGLTVDFSKVVTDQYLQTNYNGPTGVGIVRTYFNNIDTVLGMFYDAEKVIADPFRDSVISTTEDNRHALNFLGFTSSNGSPYQSIKVVNAPGSTRMTKNTNIFLKGSNDGDISEQILDAFVAEDMEEYDSATSEYNDIVLHPASIIYDSGFSMATKKSMCKFISRRKDTFVVLSTYAYNNPANLLADQYSIGVALKTMIELFPESEVFGTPVMRGMIMPGSGYIVNSPYLKRVPSSYDLINKAARYMGASNGAWKNGYAFDRAPLSIITTMRDMDVTWVPAVTRNAMWSVGLNFALNYKVKTQFFPALQTVYENDTSILNSFFTVVAIAYLNKIAHSAWREYTGSVSLTNAQLEEQVNNYVASMVKDKFDGMFVIVPDCRVTEADALRGYSWTLGIKIYANNMKTVCTTHVEAYRMTDLNP